MTSNSSDICSFCLGSDTDIPPFGKSNDASAIIRPCSTCSISAHKKCLIDWFNVLPAEKLITTYPVGVASGLNVPGGEYNYAEDHIDRSDYRGSGEDSDASYDDDGADDPETHDHNDSHSQSETSIYGDDAHEFEEFIEESDAGSGHETDTDDSLNYFYANDPDRELIATLLRARTENALNANGTRIDINISPQSFRRWLSSLTSDIRIELPESPRPGTADQQNLEGFTVYLSAPCPQCRSNITFRMQRSLFIALNSLLRKSLSKFVKYGGLSLSLACATTGVITLGYVGLAETGLNALRCIIPSPILLNMLSKKNSSNIGALARFFPLSQESLRTPDMITRATTDQFKLSHIPLLPIVMYRMRSSSIADCIFGNSSASLNDWLAELTIANYISSWGDHQLVKSLFGNSVALIRDLSKRRIKSLSMVPSHLVKGISIWQPNVMIGLLIPARWAYDLFFRLTFNKYHFDSATMTRPHVIANSITQSELSNLEDLQNDIVPLENDFRRCDAHKQAQLKTLQARKGLPLMGPLLAHAKARLDYLSHILSFNSTSFPGSPSSTTDSHSINLPWEYIKLKVKYWYYTSKVCLRTDYSTSLLYRSLTIRGITSFIWPYVSSEVGKIIRKLVLNESILPRLGKIDPSRLAMMSNIIGLIVVVLAKDVFNVIMSKRKAEQVSNMVIVKFDKKKKHADNTNQRSEVVSQGFPGGFPG